MNTVYILVYIDKIALVVFEFFLLIVMTDTKTAKLAFIFLDISKIN